MSDRWPSLKTEEIKKTRLWKSNASYQGGEGRAVLKNSDSEAVTG